MRSVKVTCLMLLVGLTCVALALVAAAPGQQAPSTDPGAVTGIESSVPAPASAGMRRTAAEASGSASERLAAPADGAGAVQADHFLLEQLQQAAVLGEQNRLLPIYNASPYGSGMGVMGVLAADPEVAKWMKEVAKTEAEQGQLLAMYAQAADEKQRAEIKASLGKVLERQFDLQLHQREREVSEIEARVKKLREMIAKRNAARQTIVTGRLDQLLNEMDGMGWAAPSGPMSPSGSYQYNKRPGLNRGGASGGNTVKRSSDQPEEPKAVSWGIAPGGAGTESGPASTRSGGGSIGPGGAGMESGPASTRPDAGSSGPGGASGRQKSAPKL